MKKWYQCVAMVPEGTRFLQRPSACYRNNINATGTVLNNDVNLWLRFMITFLTGVVFRSGQKWPTHIEISLPALRGFQQRHSSTAPAFSTTCPRTHGGSCRPCCRKRLKNQCPFGCNRQSTRTRHAHKWPSDLKANLKNLFRVFSSKTK